MAKMGRPKSEKPKSNKVSVRFDEEEYERLKQFAVRNHKTLTEAVREGVGLLLSSEEMEDE